MTDNVSKIKDRLGIVDVVSGYLKLQKAGASFKAPCPFHNEKTPSFFLSPERQIWRCFGCQKGGDIFEFIKEIEGVEFPEALRILALKAGIELEAFDSSVKDEKERLYQTCETAARFFEKQLGNSNSGKSALSYLRERGLEDSTVFKFRLGFAPDTWDSLTKYLRSSGFSEQEIVNAGMAIKRESSVIGHRSSVGIYDRFRSRIMFPIADINGRVVGFTGRIFRPAAEIEPAFGKQGPVSASQREGNVGSGEAKYINTPQTLIYDKSSILYGLNLSRGDIRKNNKCLLVEGNMDAIMSYQAGVCNVVASSGTALTPMHLSLLKRFTTNLDFSFDSDSAGAMATRRGIGMAIGSNFNVKVVTIGDKECKDPADYVKRYGAAWKDLVVSAKPVMEYYFSKAKETFDPSSVENKKSIILSIAPFLKRISSRVEKSHWINQLAFLLRSKEEDVESDILSAVDDLSVPVPKLISVETKRQVSEDNAQREGQHRNWDAEALLSIVIKKPELFQKELSKLDKSFLNTLSAEVVLQLEEADIKNFNFGNFLKKFDSDKTLDLEFVYLRSQALWDGFSDDELRAEYGVVLNKMKQKSIRLRLTVLGHEMRAAEASGEKNKIADLALKFDELTRELAETHKT